ncbi:hypothetical protein KIPB_016978, partial [Kipferlia bialata]
SGVFTASSSSALLRSFIVHGPPRRQLGFLCQEARTHRNTFVRTRLVELLMVYLDAHPPT